MESHGKINSRQDVWPRGRNFIGGYVSGMALVLVGHPFDTMKVRLQIEGKSGRFSGPISCVAETFRNEGVRGFYKGLTPPLFATGIINSVLFGLQGLTIHTMKTIKGEPHRAATVVETGQAAIVTGAIISLLVTPMEGVKSRRQIQYASCSETKLYKGPIDCASKVVAKLGVRGLYRGIVPVALCRMSNWSYFGSYEYFKQRFSPPVVAGSKPKLSFGASVLSGGLAGICYWLSCYPMDVIKARILAAPDVRPPVYKGIVDCGRIIYRTEGFRGFFAGFTPCLLRAFPANAACFVAFEIVMSILPM